MFVSGKEKKICVDGSRFDRSLSTLFCVASGLAGWTDVLQDLGQGGSIGADFFFIATFMVIMNWTLLQVYDAHAYSQAGQMDIKLGSVYGGLAIIKEGKLNVPFNELNCRAQRQNRKGNITFVDAVCVNENAEKQPGCNPSST